MEPIGEGLRRQREEAGLGLRALARDVGVSASFISQIEHGRATPSVGTLCAIAARLGISLDELLFEGPRASRPSNHWRAPSDGPVLRATNRLRITLAGGVRWERLTASHDPMVEFLYCTYPVGGESTPADSPVMHAGSEYGLIISGRCGATIGADTYDLSPGDSIAFDSSIPHRIWNLGDDAEMIAAWTVIGRHGDPRVP